MKFDLFFSKTVTFKVIAVHLICWIIFVFYELASLYYAYGELESPQVYICYYSLNISFFYCNAALLDRVFNDKKTNYLKGIFLFLGLLLAYSFLKLVIGYFLQLQQLPVKPYFQSAAKAISTSLFRVAYFTVLSIFYWATGHISNFRKQAAEAEKQELIALKDKAELESRLAEARNAYLKHQLNPHLLFNSLNFIYNSVYQNAPDAANCVILLSDIMRFSLEESGTDGKVALSSEVDQLKRLIEINRFRFDQPLQVNTEFNGCSENYRIIPLILFTLAENLFKHGNLLDAKNPALLNLTVYNNGKLAFHCKNLKKSKSDHLPGQQVGIRNVRLRLDFAYPGNYNLFISEDDDFYQTFLIINL